MLPLVAVVAVTVSACGSTSGSGSASTSKHPTIAWVQIGANNPFWTDENIGAAEAARRNGFTFKTLSGNNSVSTQSSEVEQLVNEHVSTILLTAIDPASMAGALNYAKRHGVPVISLYSTTKLATMSAEFDEAQVGHEMGVFSINLLKQRYGQAEGNVAVLGLSLGQTLEKYRIGGFVKVMKEYPKIHVVAEEPTESLADKAQSLMQDWLTRFPSLSLVYGGSDTITVPAITVAQRSNKVCKVTEASWKTNPSCIIFTSVDGDPIGITAIGHGTLAGTDLFAPYWAGYQFAMAGDELATGKMKPHKMTLDALPVDSSNVACIDKMQTAMGSKTKTFNFQGSLKQIAARYGCKTVSIGGSATSESSS